MNQQQMVAEGKRLFVDLVNKSDAAKLHPVENDPTVQ